MDQPGCERDRIAVMDFLGISNQEDDIHLEFELDVTDEHWMQFSEQAVLTPSGSVPPDIITTPVGPPGSGMNLWNDPLIACNGVGDFDFNHTGVTDDAFPVIPVPHSALSTPESQVQIEGVSKSEEPGLIVQSHLAKTPTLKTQKKRYASRRPPGHQFMHEQEPEFANISKAEKRKLSKARYSKDYRERSKQEIAERRALVQALRKERDRKQETLKELINSSNILTAELQKGQLVYSTPA